MFQSALITSVCTAFVPNNSDAISGFNPLLIASVFLTDINPNGLGTIEMFQSALIASISSRELPAEIIANRIVSPACSRVSVFITRRNEEICQCIVSFNPLCSRRSSSQDSPRWKRSHVFVSIRFNSLDPESSPRVTAATLRTRVSFNPL